MALNMYKLEHLESMRRHEKDPYKRDQYELAIRDELRNNGIDLDEYMTVGNEIRTIRAPQAQQIAAPVVDVKAQEVEQTTPSPEQVMAVEATPLAEGAPVAEPVVASDEGKETPTEAVITSDEESDSGNQMS